MNPRPVLLLLFLGWLPSLFAALTFDSWRTANFTPAQLSDQTVSSATADPDADGAVNLQEYVFFGRPLTSEATLQPQLELIAGTLALTYRERHDLTGVSIRLQGSDTLTNWITFNTVTAADRVAHPGYDEVTLLDPAPYPGTRRFLRLRLELLPVPALRAASQLALTAATPTQWTVSWTDPNTAETGYAIERQNHATNAWERLATVPADVNTWTHPTADAAQGSAYRVIALGAGGPELISDPATLPDTDGDGLPDAFELATAYAGETGTYATDPHSADTDDDGVADTLELLAHTNPTDYYNGHPPTITTVSGTDQAGPPGYFLLYPWVVRVTDAAGTPLVNAPVTYTATGATVGFSTARDDLQPVLPILIVRTDAQGYARAYWKL